MYKFRHVRDLNHKEIIMFHNLKVRSILKIIIIYKIPTVSEKTMGIAFKNDSNTCHFSNPFVGGLQFKESVWHLTTVFSILQ